MAEWQVIVLGCYCDLLSDRVSINEIVHEAGAAAEVASSHKEEKYADLDSYYLFRRLQPLW